MKVCQVECSLGRCQDDEELMPQNVWVAGIGSAVAAHSG